MRLVTLLFATMMFVGGNAFAQGPVSPQPGGSAPAGQVPTTSEGSTTPGAADQEPARAPGSKGAAGTTSQGASENSGSTTYYAPAKEADPIKWPCAQPRVATISAGTIWSGPNVAEGQGWDDDNELAGLAQKLASRRTSLDEANDLIVDFANKAGKDKDTRLTKLFVGVLEVTNDNRGEILQGIMRYARGQERLAERMRDESDKISEKQENATASDIGVATDQQNKDFAWDQRIFKERRQALSYVCETPSLLERRVYEIAKRIQAQL